VAHDNFINMNVESLLNELNVFFDVKGVFDRRMVDGRL
jgi:hypothetical protein